MQEIQGEPGDEVGAVKRYWMGAVAQTSAKITHDGRTQSIRAWAREVGISLPAMRKRLQTWKNTGLALSAPSGTRGKRA